MSRTNFNLGVSSYTDGIISLSIAENQAQDIAGNGNLESNLYAITYNGIAPQIPQNFSAASGNKQITLSWDNNTEGYLQNYYIYSEQTDFSLYFDGVNDYVILALQQDSLFSGTNAFSISFDIFGNLGGDDGTYHNILGKGLTPNGVGENPKSFMLLKQSNVLSFILYQSDGVFIAKNISLENLASSEWNQITITYEGGLTAGSLDLYKNGFLCEAVEEQNLGSYDMTASISEPFYRCARRTK